MFIFNKAKTVAVLLAEFGGAEGPGGLGPEDPRLVPLQTLLKNRGAQLEEFDNRHVLAAFESTDNAVEAARELHLALISTEPPTSPVHMALHAGSEGPGKTSAKGALGLVVHNVAALADQMALVLSEPAWKALTPALQGSAVSSLKPVPQGAGGALYEMPWTEPSEAERTRMVTMMFEKQDITAVAHLVITYRDQQIQVSVSQPAIIMGRSSQCDLIVNHQSASRLHARIEYKDGNFVLVDQSGNGTFVRFSDGDKIKVHNKGVPIRGAGDIGLGDAKDAMSEDAVRFICVE